jgi:ribonuclease R
MAIDETYRGLDGHVACAAGRAGRAPGPSHGQGLCRAGPRRAMAGRGRTARAGRDRRPRHGHAPRPRRGPSRGGGTRARGRAKGRRAGTEATTALEGSSRARGGERVRRGRSTPGRAPCRGRGTPRGQGGGYRAGAGGHGQPHRALGAAPSTAPWPGHAKQRGRTCRAGKGSGRAPQGPRLGKKRGGRGRGGRQ